MKNKINYFLTVTTACGVISTFVTTIISTAKAIKIVEDNGYTKDIFKNKEKIKEAGKKILPLYILPCAIMTGTVASACTNTAIFNKKNAALAGGIVALETAYGKYRTMTKKLVGDKNEQTIQKAVLDEELYLKTPCTDKIWFYDENLKILDNSSDGFFKASKLDVSVAENEINRCIALKGYVSLKKFYEILGINYKNDIFIDYGWSIDTLDEQGFCYIDVNHTLVMEENGNKYYILEYVARPTIDYMDKWN